MLLIVLGCLIIPLAFLALFVLVFYFIIKTAVKNGVIAAYSIIKDEEDKI